MTTPQSPQIDTEEFLARFPSHVRPQILAAQNRLLARLLGIATVLEARAAERDDLARDCQVDATNEQQGDWTR